MKKTFLILLYISALFFLHSCIVDLGIKTRYKKLTDSDKTKVVFLDTNLTNINELKNDGKIYAITGQQLLKSIEEMENVMVYKWKPYCSSEFCYPLTFIQNYCDSNGLILFVIVDHYDPQLMFTEIDITKPLFSINEKYYKTCSRTKLSKKFFYDIIKDEKLTNETYGKPSKIFKYGKLECFNINMEDDHSEGLQPFEFKFEGKQNEEN